MMYKECEFGRHIGGNSLIHRNDFGAKRRGGKKCEFGRERGSKSDKHMIGDQSESSGCKIQKHDDLPTWGGKRRRSSGFELQLIKKQRNGGKIFSRVGDTEMRQPTCDDLHFTLTKSPPLLVSQSSSQIRSAKGSGLSWWDRLKHRRCSKTQMSELRSRSIGDKQGVTCKRKTILYEVGDLFSRREHQSEISSLGNGTLKLEKEHKILYRGHQSSCSPITSLDPSSLVANWDGGSSRAHERVKKTLDIFRSLCREFLREGKIRRIDCEANRIMKARRDFVDIQKRMGCVPGVDVGDEFHYRTEVALVDLHKPLEAGIDLMRYGTNDVCISVVAVECGDYTNNMKSAEFITFCGQGGNVGRTRKEPEDQKLEKGNLALKNSIIVQNPVRVIRGNRAAKTYIYDGLYKVETFRLEKAAHGKMIFKFDLRRIPGQPLLSKAQWWKLRGCS